MHPHPQHTNSHTDKHTHSCLTLPRTPPVSAACIIRLHLSFCVHSASHGRVNQQHIVLLHWGSLWPFMACAIHNPVCYLRQAFRKSLSCVSDVLLCIYLLFQSFNKTKRCLKNLRSKLKIEEIRRENVTFFIPKRLCVYLSFSLWSPLGKAVGTWILSRQEEIKQGVSQWHRESDNGTIEVLSIVTLSLEKSSKKEIPPLTLSYVWLFILTFLSFS